MERKKKGFVGRVGMVYDLIRGTSQVQISAYAASSAFFLFLSLVPIILLVCSIIPYTRLSQDMVLDLLNNYLGQIMPENVMGLFENIVDDIYSSGLLTLSVSAVATVWSAGKAFLAIMRGLDNIHQEGMQNYIIARFKACLYTVVMLFSILFLLLVVVFGNTIVSFITNYIPDVEPFLTWILNRRFPFSVLGLTVVFTVIYTFVPKKKLKLLTQIPGAVFAALVWLGFSWLFSTYINITDGFGTYGSLTTIVIAMLWMYYCMYILLIGAYLNVRLEEHRTNA